MRTAWITLGRYGDVVNTLPLVLADFQSGNHPVMVVSRPYANLLDGVGYCDRLVWDGDYSRPMEALAHLESARRFDEINVAQCYGTTHDFHCQSFAEEAWRLVGRYDLWGKIPLVFDRRDIDREMELLGSIGVDSRSGPTGKPILLVSHQGISSPFQHAGDLMQMISGFTDRFDVIDLSSFRAERFYDLIGLYERAACLISTDTGTLHLAQAVPSLPVIALVTHSPTMWHGCPARPNHVVRIRYIDFPVSKFEIVRYLENPTPFHSPKIVHVWNDYDRRDDAARRHAMAKQSWNSEYSRGLWIDRSFRDDQFVRNTSTECGDVKAVPFVNDLIDRAANSCAENDIIVLTNDDTVFVDGLTDKILKAISSGPFWGGRYEHARIRSQPTDLTIRHNAYLHCGADIFCFRRKWWLENGSEMPLMALSFEAWDLVLRRLISERGGREIQGLVAHEIHQPYWHSDKNRECPGNLFNRAAAVKFFSTRGGWPKV